MMGSTDVGDVSWVVPTVQARVATHAIGTPGHSWQITAQGKSGQAKKGMVNAAKVMAGVAVDALGDPALIARAKADLKARTDVTPYDCPLPADVQAAAPAAARGLSPAPPHKALFQSERKSAGGERRSFAPEPSSVSAFSCCPSWRPR